MDSEVLEAVSGEWLRGAGGSVTVRTVLRLLQNLEQAYGDRFDLESACNALDNLARDATKIKQNLQAEKAKRH